MEVFNKIKKLIEKQESDIKLIYEKNQHSAAKRVRSSMQELRALAKELRQDIQDTLKKAKNDKTDNFQP